VKLIVIKSISLGFKVDQVPRTACVSGLSILKDYRSSVVMVLAMGTSIPIVPCGSVF
jgi:hypothetical protein